MAQLLPQGKQQYFDNAGAPLAGGKLYTYESGTTTPKTTWADADKVTANTNPVILDARGEAVVFWDGVYTVTLQTAAGGDVWTVDGVATSGEAAALRADLASTSSGNGASLVGIADAGANFASTTVESALLEVALRVGQVAILATEPRFGAVADSNGTAGNGTDNTAAFTAAIAYAVANRCRLIIPSGNGLMYRHTGPLPVLVASLASGVRKGVIIEGTGPGSIIFNDSTGDSFVLDSTAGAADMGTQIKVRNLSFHSNTGVRPTSFIRNKKGINTEVSGCHFMTVFVASGGGCVINEVAYGLRYIDNIHRGVVGDALVLRLTWPETSGYSFVVTVERCDFSFCTRGIYAEGANCLSVHNSVFQENTDSGIVVDPTVNGVFGFDIDIATCWFERNTNYDIDLRSSISSWCEAAIRHCQFGGFPPTFKGHINLGEKSRVIVFGTPAGNTVDVSGSSVASFYGVGTKAKFIKVGSFYWNEYDFAGGVNTPVMNCDAATGAIVATSGPFVSAQGSTSVDSGVATTLSVLNLATNGTWLVSAGMATGSASNWGVVGVIFVSNGAALYAALKSASVLSLGVSGANVQAAQSSGSTYTVNWSLTRIM